MPDWLINVLIQFPIVVVIGLVVWYAMNKIETNNDVSMQRETQIRADAYAEIKQAHRELIEAKMQKLIA